VHTAKVGQTNAVFTQQKKDSKPKSFLKEAATESPSIPTATSVRISRAEGETNNGKEIP
jgi:hypothetical protein